MIRIVVLGYSEMTRKPGCRVWSCVTRRNDIIWLQHSYTRGSRLYKRAVFMTVRGFLSCSNSQCVVSLKRRRGVASSELKPSLLLFGAFD